MQQEFDLNREQEILSLMTKSMSITDLKALVTLIADKSPGIAGAVECLVYLQPKYVAGIKSTSNLLEDPANVVVLAATSKESQLPNIGEEYFLAGEGITGWVYKYSRILRINNVFNDKELIQISPYLSWVKKHDSKNETPRPDIKYPLLAVPLIFDDKPIGTLEYHRSINGDAFLDTSEEIAVIISKIFIAVFHNLRAQEQNKALLMSLAHEINTPLTGILADSENLYREAPESSEIKKIAEHNLGQVLRLHMLASTIMSVLLERSQVRRFSEHSIYRPLIEARQLFEPEALANGFEITVPRAVDGNFPSIEMSLFDLTTAFKNIIHNALKYSFKPPNNSDARRTIKIWGEWDKDKNNYLVHVQNYGVGISQDEIKKKLIFQPYYRGEKASDRRRTGSGFGLAQARSAIEDLHHGSISLTSVPVAGEAHLTTFTIALPVKQPKE